jgi:alpha/beta superfamily hydrolase
MIADVDANEPREVRVARGLVAEGVAVNRFFHRGTGDSYGDFAGATFADLVADAEVALADLARDVGPSPIAVMGSRLGALVAAAVAQRHDLDLVLWDPVTIPARHVKELLRTQMVHLMKVKESGHTAGGLKARLEEGEMIDVFGWDFPGTVFRSLADDYAAAIGESTGTDRSVFVLTTQDHGADLGALVPDGVGVEREEIPTREPLWLANFDLATHEASLALIDRTVKWVAARVADSDRVTELRLAPPAEADFGEDPRERAVFLDAGDEQLAAYLTEPSGPANGQGLVMMPGAGHGTAAGPNRLWTRLARRLADDGYTVLRFTYRCTSNSTGDRAVFELARPLEADGRAAVDAMRATGVDEISLMGWCYGAVVATVVAEPGVKRVIMLSPTSRSNTLGIGHVDHQRAENMGLGHMARSFLSPAKWRALADPGQRITYVRMIRAKGRQLLRGRAGGARRGDEPDWLNHTWLDGLERIARRSDTEVRILFGLDDVDYRDYQTIREGRLSGILSRLGDRLEIHRRDGSIHQLHTPMAQEIALTTVERWMAGQAAENTVDNGTGPGVNGETDDGE